MYIGCNGKGTEKFNSDIKTFILRFRVNVPKLFRPNLELW